MVNILEKKKYMEMRYLIEKRKYIIQWYSKIKSLSHNLYNIYEGITISSITKNGERQMNVKLNDIKPFIPFARDSEGGITSFFKLASDKGEGDLIFDGGFTKIFINMKEKGTFRYVQNIIGFTSRPEVRVFILFFTFKIWIKLYKLSKSLFIINS